eukprot:s9831_g2.t1
MRDLDSMFGDRFAPAAFLFLGERRRVAAWYLPRVRISRGYYSCQCAALSLREDLALEHGASVGSRSPGRRRR